MSFYKSSDLRTDFCICLFLIVSLRSVPLIVDIVYFFPVDSYKRAGLLTLKPLILHAIMWYSTSQCLIFSLVCSVYATEIIKPGNAASVKVNFL